MNSHEVTSDSLDSRPFDDDRLEMLLVHLVGRLEQQMTTLEPADHIKRMIRTIDVSLGMLVTIIDTAIENYDVNFFSDELPSVWRLRERSKVVLEVLDRELWGNGFSLSPRAKNTTLATHRNLGSQFVQTFRELFARFTEEFQSEKVRGEFRESYLVFLEDFQKRW